MAYTERRDVKHACTHTREGGVKNCFDHFWVCSFYIVLSLLKAWWSYFVWIFTCKSLTVCFAPVTLRSAIDSVSRCPTQFPPFLLFDFLGAKREKRTKIELSVGTLVLWNIDYRIKSLCSFNSTAESQTDPWLRIIFGSKLRLLKCVEHHENKQLHTWGACRRYGTDKYCLKTVCSPVLDLMVSFPTVWPSRSYWLSRDPSSATSTDSEAFRVQT